MMNLDAICTLTKNSDLSLRRGKVVVTVDGSATSLIARAYGIKDEATAEPIVTAVYKAQELKDEIAGAEFVRLYNHFVAVAQSVMPFTMEDIVGSVFAPAGPTSEDGYTVHMTKAQFSVLRDAMPNPASVLIMNDFQAKAAELPYLKPEEIEILMHTNGQQGHMTQRGPKHVQGAGTGLGGAYALLDPHIELWVPYRTEMGHSPLPIDQRNAKEDLKVLEAVKGHLNQDTLNCESIIRGDGAQVLFNAVYETTGKAARRLYEDEVRALAAQAPENRNRFISETANAHKGTISYQAMEMFWRYHAIVARMAVANCQPTGGLYLSGGVTIHDRQGLINGPFMQTFDTYGPDQNEIAQNTQIVRVIPNDIGVRGLLRVAMNPLLMQAVQAQYEKKA